MTETLILLGIIAVFMAGSSFIAVFLIDGIEWCLDKIEEKLFR